MGRPREANVTKWALWKRAERDTPGRRKCQRCGTQYGDRNMNKHHTGSKHDNSKIQHLCDACHATVDNPKHK